MGKLRYATSKLRYALSSSWSSSLSLPAASLQALSYLLCSYFSFLFLHPPCHRPFLGLLLSTKQRHCPPAASQLRSVLCTTSVHSSSTLWLKNCPAWNPSRVPSLDLPSPRDPTEPAATVLYLSTQSWYSVSIVQNPLCSSISALPPTQLSSDSFCCLVIISITSTFNCPSATPPHFSHPPYCPSR